MARIPKKLRIEESSGSKELTRVHYDDTLSHLADKHYGYYLMTTLNKYNIHNNEKQRVYLDAIGVGSLDFRLLSPEEMKSRSLVGEDFKHSRLGKIVVNTIFKERRQKNYTQRMLKGLRHFIDYLNSVNLVIGELSDITVEVQKGSYKYTEKNKSKTVVRCLRDLFTSLERFGENFKAIRHIIAASKRKSKTTAALPSSVVYQLEYWAKKEIESIIDADDGTSSIEGTVPRNSHIGYIPTYCFNNFKMYPFVLYLMIKHGLNLETLNSWKVEKRKDGKYQLVADHLDAFTIIEGFKNRSNSPITSVIGNKSTEKKYIDFLLRHLAPIYDASEHNNFLQYYNTYGEERAMPVKGTFFTNLKLSSYKYSFYRKYEILDLDGNRISHIDHRALRKSHNYQDYLRGKTEFERQIRKAHKSGDTTKIYYEDLNSEWNESKKHKIALAQNLVVGIFTGKISREEHKTAKLIYGAIGDCADNKNPTFQNAPTLKDNEYCSDWTKCLSQCDKCRVIPKVHGPVIYAWINYMDEQKEEFLREQDWEKEYLVDYLSAEDTVKHFTTEESEHSKKEAHKHKDFVRIQLKFKKTVKIKESRHA